MSTSYLNQNSSLTSVAQVSPRAVLYIEDNQANLLLVEQLLARRSELTLLTAIDADRGLDLARHYQPDVILMDINLPGISGFDALTILQEDPILRHIPVIALTSNASLGQIEKGIQAGFFRYLIKPFRVSELMDMLDAALFYVLESRSAQ